MNLNQCEKCLAFIAHGKDALQQENFKLAEASFRMALTLAQSGPAEGASDLIALVLYSLSLLRHRQAREDESQQFREQAAAHLNNKTSSTQISLFQILMARVLTGLGEYRRAIPYYENVIQLAREENDPIGMAELLWRVGECYSRSGLKDHAAIPLRAAVKFFSNHPEDPRLPAILVTLGNALRKRAPQEAESYYRQAADLHIAKAQLQSATAAWVNIGILCSEQGRHAESLALYEKVLRVREQSPGTSLERIGSVLNNIANCYRRMGKIAEAFASVDRAIEVLKSDKGNAGRASAYGTRGLIFRDDRRDAEAVEWLRKAYAEHQKVPSPNLEAVVEDLENEIAALKRLGKPEESSLSEQRLELVRAIMKASLGANQDISTLDTPTQGAVFVEMNFGNSSHISHFNRESAKLARELSEIVETQNVGSCSGSVAIIESTTLIFYGADAELLFRVLEPSLVSQPMCAGARVTIRQHDKYRELVLPSTVM